MDGLAPSPRRSDRPMVSQDAGRGSDGRRRRPGGLGMLEPADDGNLSLGRRIGVLVVLAALGGAIVLAAGGVGGNHPVTPGRRPRRPRRRRASTGTSGPLPSPPTAAPVISVPDDTLLATSRTVTLRVTVPEPGTTMSGLVVHVYRNSKLLTTQKVTKVGRMKVPGVPLRRGTNKLTATIANAGGEGPRSAIVTITLDDRAPKVTIKSPRTNTVLNAVPRHDHGQDRGRPARSPGATPASDHKRDGGRRCNGRLRAGHAPRPRAQRHHRRQPRCRGQRGQHIGRRRPWRRPPGGAPEAVTRQVAAEGAAQDHGRRRHRPGCQRSARSTAPRSSSASCPTASRPAPTSPRPARTAPRAGHGSRSPGPVPLLATGSSRSRSRLPTAARPSSTATSCTSRPARLDARGVRPWTGYLGPGRTARPPVPDGTIRRRIAGCIDVCRDSSWPGDAAVGEGAAVDAYTGSAQIRVPEVASRAARRRGRSGLGVGQVGRERQLPEQALEGLVLDGCLPAGTHLVTLERGAAPVQGAVPEPPRDGTPEVAAAAARDGVAGTCPAPDRVGLGRAAMGTAPCLHAPKCSCTNEYAAYAPDERGSRGRARRPDQPGWSVLLRCTAPRGR